MKLRQAVLYLACGHASTVAKHKAFKLELSVSDRIHLSECTVVLAEIELEVVIDSHEGRVCVTGYVRIQCTT